MSGAVVEFQKHPAVDGVAAVEKLDVPHGSAVVGRGADDRVPRQLMVMICCVE